MPAPIRALTILAAINCVFAGAPALLLRLYPGDRVGGDGPERLGADERDVTARTTSKSAIVISTKVTTWQIELVFMECEAFVHSPAGSVHNPFGRHDDDEGKLHKSREHKDNK